MKTTWRITGIEEALVILFVCTALIAGLRYFELYSVSTPTLAVLFFITTLTHVKLEKKEGF